MTIEVCGVGKAYPKFTGRLNALATWLGLVPRVQNWAFINSLRGWLAAELVAEDPG